MSQFMSLQRRFIVLGFGILLLSAGPFIAGVASAADANQGYVASYDGRTIDLADGWQGAQGCVAVSLSNIQCFDTVAELQAAEANAAVSQTSCGSGELKLFQNEGFGGDELDISSPQGIWLDLDDFGFGNEASSWKNTMSCDAYAAKSTDGTGTQLALPANSQNSWVGDDWNDAINSVELG
jgi:hypothetical protein